jgi:hypothetical protein
MITGVMEEHTEEEIQDSRKNYPLWIVRLCHGPSDIAIITDTVHVTKKWERVEAAIDSLSQKVLTIPNSNLEHWHISVQEVVPVSSGNFPLNFMEKE